MVPEKNEMGILVKELQMSYQETAFLPFKASFHTTLKKIC